MTTAIARTDVQGLNRRLRMWIAPKHINYFDEYERGKTQEITNDFHSRVYHKHPSERSAKIQT